MISEAANRLLQGEDGKDVVEFLRRELKASAERGGRAYSVNTLKTYVSHAKAKVIEQGFRNPHCEFEPLRRFADPEIETFVNASLKTQLELQRRHRANPAWSEEAEAELQSLDLLPPNVASFKITEREVRCIKRRDKASMRAKMQDVAVVADGVALLSHAKRLLQVAQPTDTFVTLIAPLLLVSGRREIEILNVCSGRSSFEKVGQRSVRFAGQCKTKSEEGGEPYAIPLLVEADLFLQGLAVLRAKRGDLSQKSNAVIHDMMNGNFTPAFLRRTFPMLPEGSHWHLLRTLYLKSVDHCYQHSMAINHLAKLILGHQDESESLR